ncbi:OmpA family protein [Methylocaldum sp.]|uniref:OmpA family protein n=1 Tax=Methylocaldum sp. TaxID=1969727 RepID=UPI002D23D8BC|nr:OmpA family protein [Methylocaldum sp.]HYE34761.1 OmpA family protein [Methylocaldum sp.]
MLRINNYRFYPRVVRCFSLAVIAACSGCATQNESLERARMSYSQAQQDTEIAQNAPVALAEAGQALRRAEDADDEDETTHLAYIAQRKVEIARAMAETRKAEAEAQQLLDDREKLLLQQELATLKATQTERGLMVTLGDVLFEYGKADLRPGTQQRLYQLVNSLKEHPNRNVLIEGHTDSHGSEAYNEELSQRRAQAVQDFLLRNGISPDRIVTRGYGEAYPVASNDTNAGRLQNRRVEIYLSEAGKAVSERGR